MTDRQKEILYKLIQEYVSSAMPISSGYLTTKAFDVSPATMRNEMNELEKSGFLDQLHVSSGRVPTDKAYRFFVDQSLAITNQNQLSDQKIKKQFLKDIEGVLEKHDFLKRIQELAKTISQTSGSLVLVYFPNDNLVLNEGWDKVLLQPEFNDPKYTKNFIKMISKLEKNMDKIITMYQKTKDPDKILVYIGKEIGFEEAKDFSILISKCSITKQEKTSYLALIGPKRMSYQRNISLISQANKCLSK
jgi:heat-inducible transcriptional repressor